MLALLGTLLMFVTRSPVMRHALHSMSRTCSPAAWCWSASCCCTRTACSALLNVFALHAAGLSLSVAWQAYMQNAPHLYVTAAIALVLKAIMIPSALRRIVRRLGIHREIETAVGIGPTMLAGVGLVALSIVLMLKVTAGRSAGARGPRLCARGDPARPADDGDATQRRQPGRRFHVDRERLILAASGAAACRWSSKSASLSRC